MFVVESGRFRQLKNRRNSARIPDRFSGKYPDLVWQPRVFVWQINEGVREDAEAERKEFDSPDRVEYTRSRNRRTEATCKQATGKIQAKEEFDP